MLASPKGQDFIKSWELCKLLAYDDGVGVWTIGWGTTRYFGGAKVKKGDKCSQPQAAALFAYDLRKFELSADALTTDAVTQRQFDMVVSFCYNCGETNYTSSTLRKRINADPDDKRIRAEFMKWHFANGKPMLGLWRRRHAEADFYFGVTTTCPPMPK